MLGLYIYMVMMMMITDDETNNDECKKPLEGPTARAIYLEL